MKRFVQQAVSLGACGAAIVLFAAPAESAPKKPNVCGPAYTAYKAALKAEKAGHYHEARESLLKCTQSGCGGLAPKCVAANDKIVSEMPSVVFLVTDETDAPRVDVEVKVDGDVLTSHLDGKGLPVEPGLHEFSFGMDGKVFETKKIMILEGQQNRVIAVAREPPGGRRKAAVASAAPSDPGSSTAGGAAGGAAADEASTDRPSHDEASHEVLSSTNATGGSKGWKLPHTAWPYLSAGVGVVGLAAGGLMTYWGNKDNKELVEQCAPSCNPASVDHVHTMYIASDVAFGVGAAALGLSALLFATAHPSERAPAPAAAVIDVAPTRSGAVASVFGTF